MTPQEKKFAIILAIITATCSAGLYYWASMADTRYDESKISYDEASAEINRYYKLDLTPSQNSLDEKQKAVKDFDKQSKKLIEELRKFGSEPLTNTDAQAFTDKLVKEVSDAKAAYKEKETTLPEGFFLGFEKYANTPAQQGATGLLTYQLDAMSEITRALADAKPVALLNLFREPQPEETGKEYKASTDSIYRALPMELAFSGSEKTLRTFLDSMQSSKKHFYVIRSMRVSNEKLTPPLASEARFETAEADEKKEEESFGAFILPGDPAPGGEAPKPEPAKTVVAEEILKEVLGSENINVFLRIDVLRYHQAELTTMPKKK